VCDPGSEARGLGGLLVDVQWIVIAGEARKYREVADIDRSATGNDDVAEGEVIETLILRVVPDATGHGQSSKQSFVFKINGDGVLKSSARLATRGRPVPIRLRSRKPQELSFYRDLQRAAISFLPQTTAQEPSFLEGTPPTGPMGGGRVYWERLLTVSRD
jgi:hypothetical protein